MKKLASMGAVFALAALVTACGPEANDVGSGGQPPEPRPPEAVIDMTQPVDKALFTAVRSNSYDAGLSAEFMTFDPEPITLETCKNLATQAAAYSRITCLNDGKYVATFNSEGRMVPVP